jgi:CBS domain-containing protein
MTMRRFFDCTVGQYMNPKPRSVSPSTPLRDLEQLFEELDFNAFPVTEADRLVGFVTKYDLLKAFIFTPRQMLPHYDELMTKTVADVMSRSVTHVEAGAPLTRVLQLMVETKARSFPVLDQGRVIGMLSRTNIMRALKDCTNPTP